MRVFADAFYFIARLNRRDPYRSRVLNLLQGFEADIVTTEWVLMEVVDALASSQAHGLLYDYVTELRNSSSCEVVPASSELFNRALNFFHRHNDKEWSLTDCTSFIVMRDLGIKEALTGDKHFEQAGFVALLK